MPDLAPFHGLRFDPERVDPASVTAPPYDVISAADRAELEERSPHNVVRLILGPLGGESGEYSQSRTLLDSWIDDGILAVDDAPSLTIYEQRFRVDGSERRQLGVFAAVALDGQVLPHERVMGPVVDDRLAVIRATEANLSPVFCLYWSDDDPLAELTRNEPSIAFTSPDGIGHRAWKVTDPESIARIVDSIGVAPTIIADGHHRYRTAEAYRDERRERDGDGPWDRMMLYLVDARRHGPALLPIHRLLSGLEADEVADVLAANGFSVEPGPPDADELAAEVARRRPARRCYGILGRGAGWIASLEDESLAADATRGDHSDAWRDLDVAVLHALVFDRLLAGKASVTYVHHPTEAAEAVGDGSASAAVLLAPTPVSAVRAVAERADSMPPKSTFFIPKPLTGIVLRLLRRPG